MRARSFHHPAAVGSAAVLLALATVLRLAVVFLISAGRVR
jgi:hypothetical protein